MLPFSYAALYLSSKRSYCQVDLKPVQTVAEKCECRRKVRLLQKSATVAVVSPFSATVALFCDSVETDRALGYCIHGYVFASRATCMLEKVNLSVEQRDKIRYRERVSGKFCQ